MSTFAVPHLGVCGWAQCRCGVFWWPLPCRWQDERHSRWDRAARCPGPGKPPLASDSSLQSLHLPPVKRHNTQSQMLQWTVNQRQAIKQMSNKEFRRTDDVIKDYACTVTRLWGRQAGSVIKMWQQPKPGAHFDKRISNDFPFLLRVGCHIQSLADAFSWRPVLLRDGEGCCSVVEGVSRIYH